MEERRQKKLAALVAKRNCAELQDKLQLKLWLEGLKARTRVPKDEAQGVVAAFRRDGVCRIPGCVDAATVRKCREHASERVARILGEVSRRGLNPEGLKTREIVSRSRGRFDVALDDRLAWTGGWVGIVRRILGAACELLKSGVVVALPGAQAQQIHVDGKSLFDGDDFVPLPPHCLTVFVPLVDLRPELGPTEFFPGSHLADSTVFDAAMRGDADSVTFDDAVAGDAILFDYRIKHRGLANTHTHPRPLLYFTYAKPWFRDATNYSSLPLADDDDDSSIMGMIS
ncbi:hypothetical protein CTAYLR_010400 [Chrysophaeum taylorii]|uniref:Phytanoyl-CoA dioxygenase n=1 Tax=Chrysophaeum taylorii TaxID=2483200 RepID=A0AAD7UIG7_9STRA|nr:hypothetical protein CTAYLR_010400 [Chrysophaeum taylorii]